MSKEPVAKPKVMAVFPPGEDRTSLNRILGHSGWELQFTGTFEEMQTSLSAGPATVILSEGRLSDGHCWKDILHELQRMPDPPPLVVADRLADETLWAEVLNLGGYDLLAKPFNDKEVLHAVGMAWQFYENERERTLRARKPPKPAEHASVLHGTSNAVSNSR